MTQIFLELIGKLGPTLSRGFGIQVAKLVPKFHIQCEFDAEGSRPLLRLLYHVTLSPVSPVAHRVFNAAQTPRGPQPPPPESPVRIQRLGFTLFM
jgi:hypothetical protein